MARKIARPVVEPVETDPPDETFDETETEIAAPMPRLTAKMPSTPSVPAPPMARVNVSMELPPERFARLAQQDEPGTTDEETIDQELADLLQSPNNVLHSDKPPETDRRAQYVEEAKKENELRAHIYRIPDRIPAYAIPDKLPKTKVGWLHYGAIPFDPDSYEDEIQRGFPPGNYWLDIRKSGQFVTKEVVSVAANPLQSPDGVTAAPSPAPAALAPMPLALDAPALSADKQLKSVFDLAERLLKLQPQHTAAPPPTLREQLAELRELQKLFQPQQATPAQNPLEDLVKVVQSEAFKQIKEMMRSPEAGPKTTWMDVIRDMLPYFGPAIAPLVAVASQAAAKQVARAYAANAPQPGPVQGTQHKAANTAPQPTPPEHQPPRAVAPAPPPPLTGTDEEWEEEELNPIQQLVQDLSEQRPVAESAELIRASVQRMPLLKGQVKKLIESENAKVWEMLSLIGVPEEVLADISWKDDWLNELRKELQKSPL